MESEAATALGSALLGALPQPSLSIDSELLVHFSNPAASALLDLEDGLRLVHGRLVFQSLHAQTQVEHIARMHASHGQDLERLLIRVPRSEGEDPWLVAVTAIRPAFAGATSLLHLIGFQRHSRIPPTILHWLYRLSPAEARLAVHLGSGDDLLAIAGQLGIQPETARSQLKTVFRKMGVHRQRQLVRLLTQIETVIGGDSTQIVTPYPKRVMDCD